jgi:hypothetical protein
VINLATNHQPLDSLIYQLGRPNFESRDAYISFCNRAVSLYSEMDVQSPATPTFHQHLSRIDEGGPKVIETTWGGVDIEKHEHPAVEKYLVVRAGRFLAYEKHEQKLETLVVQEGHGVLVFRPEGSQDLEAELLCPGYKRTLQPHQEHTIVALSNLLIFESSIDPKGMDQDLIFIYEP